MRLRYLFETPLDKFLVDKSLSDLSDEMKKGSPDDEALGDVDFPGRSPEDQKRGLRLRTQNYGLGFSDRDVKAVTRVGLNDDLARYLSKTKHKFNIFIMDKEFSDFMFASNLTHGFRIPYKDTEDLPTSKLPGVNEKLRERIIGSLFPNGGSKDLGGKITLVIVSNQQDPLTPWIILHQLGEGIDLNGLSDGVEGLDSEVELTLSRGALPYNSETAYNYMNFFKALGGKKIFPVELRFYRPKGKEKDRLWHLGVGRILLRKYSGHSDYLNKVGAEKGEEMVMEWARSVKFGQDDIGVYATPGRMSASNDFIARFIASSDAGHSWYNMELAQKEIERAFPEVKARILPNMHLNDIGSHLYTLVMGNMFVYKHQRMQRIKGKHRENWLVDAADILVDYIVNGDAVRQNDKLLRVAEETLGSKFRNVIEEAYANLDAECESILNRLAGKIVVTGINYNTQRNVTIL